MAPNYYRSQNYTSWLIILWLIVIAIIILCGIFANLLNSYHAIILGTYGSLICLLPILWFQKAKQEQGLLFLTAVVVRLVIVLALQVFPPDCPESPNRYVPGVIFEDETYYLQDARTSAGHFNQLDLTNAHERVVYYYALIFSFTGGHILWGRLANSLLGALTAVIIYDSILMAIGTKLKKWFWWFCALTPILVLWSVSYLKETLLVFGIALIVNAIVRTHKKQFGPTIIIRTLTGVFLCFWIRGGVNVIFIAPLFISIATLKERKTQISFLFKPVCSCFLMIILFSMFFPLRTVERAGRIFLNEGAVSIMHNSAELQEQEAHDIAFPFFGLVMQAKGPVRNFFMTCLLMINPVITSFWSLIPVVGNPNWTVLAINAYVISWWTCLPFVVRAAYDAWRQHYTWWISWCAGFLAWCVLASYARFGAGLDACRYRDAMVPVIMLLATKGMDSTFGTLKRKQLWRYILKGYWTVVGALIILRGLNILRMT